MAARIVNFNALPKSVRERFIGCTTGRTPPVPLVVLESPYKAAIFGWVSLALGGVALLCGSLSSSYGMRVQGSEVIFAYAFGIAAIAIGVLGVVRRLRLQRALPWKPGRYLFPMDCIDARTDKLRLIPMNTLVDFRGVHHHTNGGYTSTHLHFTFEGGISETLVVRNKEIAERALTQLRASQSEIQRAAQERDIEALFAMDPFLEVRVKDTWAVKPGTSSEDAGGPKTGALGPLASRPLILAIGAVIGVAAALPAWSVRNRMSDDAMFARAVASGSVGSFEAYLLTGKRHTSEVEATLLPKAALAAAVNEGTITALHDVLRSYPSSCIEADARAEIHRLFVKTLVDFRKEAAADPKLVPFMEKLVGVLETSESPAVDVRFRSPSVESLRAVDGVLGTKSGAAVVGEGTLIPVAPHFDAVHSVPREASIVQNLSAAFASVFPADIMKLQQGDRIFADSPRAQTAASTTAKIAGKAAKTGKTAPPAVPSKTQLPDVQIPTLDVGYEVSWAGDIYSEEKGDRKFVGIVVNFEVSMRLPKDSESYDFTLEVRPPDEFSVGTAPELGGLGLAGAGAPSEGQVYDVMAARAFDELTVKLRAVFFRPESKANVRPRSAAEPPPPASDEDDDDDERDDNVVPHLEGTHL